MFYLRMKVPYLPKYMTMLHMKYLLPHPSVPGFGKTPTQKISKFAHDYKHLQFFRLTIRRKKI
jgi:hypothetical protein